MEKQIDDFMDDHDDFQETFVGDWAKVDANLKNEGYRLGMEEGYDQCLQKGFNSAFKEALKLSLAAGKLQGNLSVHTSILPKLSNCPVLTSNQTISQAPAINSLLTSCSDLITKIPALLKNDVSNSLLQAWVKKDISERGTPASSVSCLSKHVTDSKDIDEAVKGGASCQDVCNNSEHFWTQLESFKLQAAQIVQSNH